MQVIVGFIAVSLLDTLPKSEETGKGDFGQRHSSQRT